MGTEEQFGEIVIAPRVPEKSLPSQLLKLMVSIHFQINPYLIPYQTLSLGRGVYLKETMKRLTADIYLYLEYGVKVPKVALAIQKQSKMLFMIWLMWNLLLLTSMLQESFQIKHQNLS